MPTNQSKMMQVFSGQARMLATPVVYVDFMGGSHAGALFLSQLIFWSDKGGKKDGWFYKSYKEWHEEIRLSRHHVNKFSQALVEAGVLETQLRKANGFPTLHYKLDVEKLAVAFCEFLQKGNEDDSDMRKVANPFVNFRKTITEDYLQNTEEESISFRNSTELERLSSVAQPESVSPIPSKSGLDVIERDQHRALHNVAQAEPVIAQDFATLIAESLPDTPEPVKAKSSKKAASAKSAPPPKPKREPKPPRELDQREAEFLAQVTKLDPFMGKQVESRLRKYRRDKPWSAIQVYLLTGKAVPPASLQAVTSLNGTAFDAELMLKCLSAWVSKGWSPVNLAWLLEWYKAGGPPQYTPKYAASDAYVPPPKPQALEWEDSPIGREAIARMAKQKAEKEQEMKGGA